MNRIDIYKAVVDSFEQKFDWLGKEYSEQFLLSCSSWNIQTYSEPEYRVRRHLVLYWGKAWLKSTLLYKSYQILGNDLCSFMSDITLAALRGTVESGQFVSPWVLKRPFSVCTEFGQVITGNETSDISQKMLNLLEEGVVSVSLGKIAFLTKDQRDEAVNKFGITFLDKNTFTYKTNWVLMAGTYNSKFLLDSAFESRFNIMSPENRFDSALTKHVVNSKKFYLDETIVNNLRLEIFNTDRVDCDIKLPDEIYDIKDITPRECGSLMSYILNRAWWGIKTGNDEVVEMAKKARYASEHVWMSADDKVFSCIENIAKTTDQIVDETGVSKRQVYNSLKSLRATKYIDENGNASWRIL